MVCGVFQQIKSIHHSSFLYENSDFPTFFPATFSSRVCHQGEYRFGSPVYRVSIDRLKPAYSARPEVPQQAGLPFNTATTDTMEKQTTKKESEMQNIPPEVTTRFGRVIKRSSR